MIVTKISGRNFARWGAVDIELPRTGVVLVTGKNGHGKSTIVEAVAQGVWGQTLRGAPGWRTDAKSGVEVHFDGGHVRRSVSKSKHVLKWRVGEHGAAEFATRTKSQDALASHVGSFHVWRHACTFHTRDASRFTGATDAERKRLLEEVLELDRVEAGYRTARKEIAEAARAVTAAEHALSLATTKLAAQQGTRDTLSAELETVPDLDAMRTEGRALREAMDAAKAEADTAAQAYREAHDIRTRVDVLISQAEHRQQHFGALGGVCPTCEQPIDGAHVETQQQAEAAKLDDLRGQQQQAVQRCRELDVASEAALAAHREARAQYEANVHAGKAAVEAQRRNDARQTKLETIDADIARAEQAVTQADAQHSDAQRHLAALEAAASVLSYQGVRAAMLASAVCALEDLANDWLGRLGLDALHVRLSSQSETKGGKVSDRISFDVEGAGGGLGYLAASTGEQRRIDIAVLLALGELAADSRGMSHASTLFADELFDGLDTEGQEAALQMIRDLSATRCVVVISHSAGLVHSLAPAVHLVAQDGALEVR